MIAVWDWATELTAWFIGCEGGGESSWPEFWGHGEEYESVGALKVPYRVSNSRRVSQLHRCPLSELARNQRSFSLPLLGACAKSRRDEKKKPPMTSHLRHCQFSENRFHPAAPNWCLLRPLTLPLLLFWRAIKVIYCCVLLTLNESEITFRTD